MHEGHSIRVAEGNNEGKLDGTALGIADGYIERDSLGTNDGSIDGVLDGTAIHLRKVPRFQPALTNIRKYIKQHKSNIDEEQTSSIHWFHSNRS